MNAVNSVIKQGTKYFDYEIIISDDGSTDGTKELFTKKDKRIIYFWHKNYGVNKARNLGIRKAKGDYIMFLDSDDQLTNNCFKIIYSYKEKLKEVNFFGTAEIKTGKLMYHLDYTGDYSYKDWLEQKKIKGEFLTLVKKEVFEHDLFDEKLFAFELFFWNKVIKKYGLFAVDRVCRLYSYEQENRVSKDLMKPEKALRRYHNYKFYIKKFGKDYLSFGLNKQYANILFKIGFYGILGREIKDGRAYMKKSLKNNFKFTILVILLISYLGYVIFKTSYLIILKMIKV